MSMDRRRLILLALDNRLCLIICRPQALRIQVPMAHLVYLYNILECHLVATKCHRIWWARICRDLPVTQ